MLTLPLDVFALLLLAEANGCPFEFEILMMFRLFLLGLMMVLNFLEELFKLPGLVMINTLPGEPVKLADAEAVVDPVRWCSVSSLLRLNCDCWSESDVASFLKMWCPAACLAFSSWRTFFAIQF
jgi:hypothetical protein